MDPLILKESVAFEYKGFFFRKETKASQGASGDSWVVVTLMPSRNFCTMPRMYAYLIIL